ncbi:MAG TPA: glycosyltransferase family 9 protein [Chitinophagales bacterium]|nr:glycosyltransferase family 9 protein [Chitinophagales bacterium]
MKKILLIRLSSIGDIVLTSLALRCIKNTYPEAQIDFLTKEQYVDLVASYPQISNVLLYKSSLWQIAQEVISNDYDAVIDLHANTRTRILQQLLPESIPFYRYKKQSLRRLLSVGLKRDLYKNEKVPEQYLDALKKLNVQNDGKGLEFHIPQKDWIYRSDVPLTHRSGYAVLSLGATYFTKKLPLFKWEELVQRLEFPIIIIGGEQEIALGQYLEQLDDLKIINKCGQYNLHQSASVIAQSIFVITHDTGMMHIAAALKKKVISIWGGTVPYLGFEPYGIPAEKSIFIENTELNCRPCSKYGREDCPKGHFKCMNEISVDKIIEAVGVKAAFE